jgi:hypothetical protein
VQLLFVDSQPGDTFQTGLEVTNSVLQKKSTGTGTK